MIPLLIGSRALALLDTSFTYCREDSDWDVISSSNLPKGECRVELISPSVLKNQYVLGNFRSGVFTSVNGVEVEVCSLRGLAAIKRSHLWTGRFFNKHMTQYHAHLAKHLNKVDTPFIEERAKLTKEDIGARHPILKQSNEEFFDDFVTKTYDHDWLHEQVAFYDKPIYTRLKRDDSLAWCERDLWEALDRTDQLRCVQEECYVIAAERFLIPNKWDFHPKAAYREALQKVCTTLCSGWFRDFAIDNYPCLMEMFDKTKLETLKGKLNDF